MTPPSAKSTFVDVIKDRRGGYVSGRMAIIEATENRKNVADSRSS